MAVDDEPPALRIAKVLLRGGAAQTPGLAFPASHVAVASALTVVATPYIRRFPQRVCWVIVGLIAAARVYLGLHVPVDDVGGLALGVAVVNIAVGVPARRLSLVQLTSILGPVGLQPANVEPGLTPDYMRWRSTDHQDYMVKTLAWVRPDQAWLSRLWRLAAYRQASEPPRRGRLAIEPNTRGT